MLVSLLSLLLFFQGTSFAQSNATPAQNQAQVEELLRQANEIANDDPQQALANTDLVLDFLRQNPDEVLLEQAYTIMSWVQLQQGNYEQARNTIQKRLLIAENLDDYTFAEALSTRAALAFYLSEYQTALVDFQRAVQILEESERPYVVANLYNNIGISYRRMGANDTALTYYLRALKTYDSVGANENRAKLLHNIGVLYKNMGDQEKAIETFRQVVTLKNEIDTDSYSKAQTYGQLGASLAEIGDYEEALTYHQMALEIRQELEDRSGIASVHHNLGQLYLYQNQLEQAKNAFEKALSMRERLGEKDSTAQTLYSLSDIAAKRDQNQKALGYLEQARALIGDDNQSNDARDIYSRLATVQAALGDFEAAFLAQQRFQEVQDHMVNSERIGIIANIEAKYEEEKRVKEIDLLKKENLLKSEALARTQLIRNLWIAAMLVGFTILFLVYARFQERRKLLAQRSVNDRLQRLDKLKDDFLANTSHELRTPLNGIIGLAESLADGATGPLSVETRENLGLIIASGKRLNALVNDLLDFSKMRNDRIILNQEPVDLYSLTQVVITLCKPLIDNHHLVLKNQIPKDLPAVLGDENRLQQILHNLIGNAIKFTNEGQVVVSAEQKDDMLCVSVYDTGVGIAPDQQNTIFNAFEQIDSQANRKFSGTGLGLAVSKNLVELHGGQIWVDSKIGAGSTFFFTLPKSSEKAKPREDTLPVLLPQVTLDDAPTSDPTPSHHSKGKHILIVDDDPINRQVLHNHLHLVGYELTEASSGIEALALVEQQPDRFHLVLLDIMMPGLSGYDTCQQIRKNHPLTRLPVLFLTAKTRIDDLVAGFDVGANDFLTKPINKQELLYRVNTHLTLQALNRDLDTIVQQRTADLESRNHDLETLDEVVRIVNRELNWEAQAQALLDQALKFLPPANKGMLFLRQEQGKKFGVAALNGYPSGSFETVTFSESELHRHQQRAAQVKTGVWQVADMDHRQHSLYPEQISPPKSSLGISLYVGKRLQGYLVIDSDTEEDAFEDYDLVRFERFREHASSAIGRAVYVRELVQTTQELRNAQSRLVEAAHRAGMAEIAIDVLHNLGNSLNSLNTTFIHMRQLLDDTRYLKLLKNVVNLVFEKQNQLARFITEDERGRTLPQALDRITQALFQNNEKILNEMGELSSDIEELRKSLAAQDEYARSTNLHSKINLNQTVEEALALSSEQCRKQDIEVHLIQDEDLLILASRFRFIAVINHLVRNSVEAMSETPPKGQYRLKVILEKAADKAKLTIDDNGIGLSPDQITAAFRAGYTTKTDAKGFGLHFCANAIADLGGAIQITSPGLGHGTKVNITLPLYQSDAVTQHSEDIKLVQS